MKLKFFLILSIFLIIVPIVYFAARVVPQLQLCSFSDLLQTSGNLIVLVIASIPVILGIVNLYFSLRKRINRLNYALLLIGVFITLALIFIGELGWFGPLYFVICDPSMFPSF